jgi:hypothetical protein
MEAPPISLPPLEDRSLARFVTASPDDLRYARELRERLKQLFPNRPAIPVPLWSVGAD